MAKKKREERFVAGDVVVLEGVNLRFPHLITPDTKYRPQWSTHVMLDEADATAMEELGFNVKDSTDGKYVISRRYCADKMGKPLDPPRVVSLDPSVPHTTDVGTGTVANVKMWCIYRTVKGVESLCCYLNAVQIINPVAGGSVGGFKNLADGEDADVPF